MNQNDLHVSHWEHFFSDELMASLYPTWWDKGTANHWRHERFLEAPLKILNSPEIKSSSWITIGDGSGHDTWILRQHGFENILTTDIGVGTLSRSLKEGHITRYERANAEKLKYDDNSFDFVLCKEALHHMQKPYAAIYEMLRVARKAVVIIEPQDLYTDLPCMPGPVQPTYENVGNYVYGFSSIEFQKIGYGLNLPAVATKNMVDVYIQGCEFHPATDDDPIFRSMKEQVLAAEKGASEGRLKWNYILSILFTESGTIKPGESIRDRLNDMQWTLAETDKNPYLSKGGSF